MGTDLKFPQERSIATESRWGMLRGGSWGMVRLALYSNQEAELTVLILIINKVVDAKSGEKMVEVVMSKDVVVENLRARTPVDIRL